MLFSLNTRVLVQFDRFTGEWLNRRSVPARREADRLRHCRARHEDREGSGALGYFAKERCRWTSTSPLLAYDLSSSICVFQLRTRSVHVRGSEHFRQQREDHRQRRQSQCSALDRTSAGE